MAHTINTSGGGAQTNANGLFFEQSTDLNDALKKIGYTVRGTTILKNGKIIGFSVPKKKIYNDFLSLRGVDYTKYNSKGWQPDECFINENTKTAYIIEKKFQNGSGSVDEKLPGCDFKRKEYKKLFDVIHYKVEFIYVFNDWFKQDVYIDTLQYIKDVGCKYWFNEIPLQFLGLR